ncbi:MAG: family 16 glycoside hydrolase, partial [Tepidisphaeraceae bacterium]
GLLVLTAAARAGQPWTDAVIDDWFRAAAPGVALSKDFTTAGGQWELRDGELRIGRTPGGPKAMYGVALPDEMEVSVEVFLPGGGGGNAGFIVGVADAAEGADNFTGYEVAIQADGTLVLGRHRHNFESILNKRDLFRDGSDRWIPLVVRTRGKTLDISIDGKPAASYEDKEHPLAPGRVGFRAWERTARFRNFRVSSGGGQSQPVALAPDESSTNSIAGVSANWTRFRRGDAEASFALAAEALFHEGRRQRLVYVKGNGEVGILTPPVNVTGFPVLSGKVYHGALWVRSQDAVQLHASIEATDGSVLADAAISVETGQWRTIRFDLTPSRDCDSARLAIKLAAPATIDIARVSLAPGEWAWPASLSLKTLPPILFATHAPFTPGPAVGTNIWAARPARPGCGIHVWDPAHPDDVPRTIFSDADGCIYDLNLSYDARTVFFTYQRKDEKHWHIWRIGVDGSGLKQLTDGAYHDINPCELPDGDIVFVSTRRFGHTVCQPGPASNLHHMSADGGDIHCVSMNTLSDLTPQMLPSGRVLFTRWEYIDRDLTYRQSLWTQNPDGTAYQLYFGNTIRDPGTFWQARPIPGRSHRVLATFGPHHGCIQGAIGWIDTTFGPEEPRGVGFDWITKEFPTISDHAFPWSYCDPFPLDEESFLCSYGGGGLQRYRLYLHDMQDRKRLLYEDPSLGCYNPIALRPTPRPPMTPSRLAADNPALPEDRPAAEQPTGTMLLVDVYQGLEPIIHRGQVKSIRIMEQVRKTEDLVARAFDQSPVMGYGTYYAKRSWGTVPVEEDGSAHFVAPAMREIYFQALDVEGRELQRMTSAAQLMPGEHVSCVG